MTVIDETSDRQDPPFKANDVILALSSSQRKQYVDDVLRTTALPKGAVIDFRYRIKYLDKTLRGAKKPRELPKFGVLTYVQIEPKIEVLPIRFARLRQLIKYSDFVILRFELLDHVSMNIDASTLTDLLKENDVPLPGVKEGDKWASGPFCSIVKRNLGLFCNKKPGVSWLNVADRLNKYEPFRGEVPLSFDGAFDKANKRAKIDKGVLRLRPNKEYELRIFNYVVDKPALDLYKYAIKVNVHGDLLESSQHMFLK